jgi:LmbE family N-acetylglucosaminyl deacetylase
MIVNSQKILVLAPHTDDGELGMGASISKFIRNGNDVTYVAFSTAEQSVPDGLPKDILKTEVRNATSRLGIKPENLLIFNYEVRKLNYVRQDILEELVKIRNQTRFDFVFIPSLHDIHQDHQTIAQEAVRAFKNTTILGYELIWNNLSFDTSCFIELAEEDINDKYFALQEYKSQVQKSYMTKEFIFSLAAMRGVQSGCRYAEAFEVVRLFL